MPKPRSAQLSWGPGRYYHIYNRGARRKTLFIEPDNYRFVIQKLKKYSRQFDLTVIAYCLMPNHYHILVRQNGSDRAGLLPQRVFLSYTKAFNKRYDASGTLFEGSFKTIPVDEYQYLIHLPPYIHLNPVKHGIVNTIADWPYSNYLDWIGERNGTLLDPLFIGHHYGGTYAYRNKIQTLLIQRGYAGGLD